jgi:hypothetical protein
MFELFAFFPTGALRLFAGKAPLSFVVPLTRSLTRDLGQVVATDKFFDSVSFWQQAYERSEAAQSKLQDNCRTCKM